MNDNYSHKELKYSPRKLASRLKEAAADHPVVVLTGPRQVGKSTLLQSENPFAQWKYVTLDDFEALRAASEEPESLWAGAENIVLDEVQKSPRILSAIKKEVDKRRRKIHFVLSGSANLLLMQKVSESLAGRAVYFQLYPMTFDEIQGQNGGLLASLLQKVFPADRKVQNENPIDWILRGFMPPVFTFSRASAVTAWWEGYTRTYLERDLRQMTQVDSLTDFRKVMEILALRSGQLLNQTEISRDSHVSQSTVYRYVNLLEASCLLERLPAFSLSRTKRLIKSPKIYWIDPGLASFLAGYHESDALAKSREAGAFFETMVLLHLRAACQLLIPNPKIYYWRTVNGQEVDFVIESGHQRVAVEVKISATAHFSDTENLRVFIKEYPETKAGVLVYGGHEIKRLHENIVAIPWHCLS